MTTIRYRLSCNEANAHVMSCKFNDLGVEASVIRYELLKAAFGLV
jgi:hypothetical protein